MMMEMKLDPVWGAGLVFTWHTFTFSVSLQTIKKHRCL